MSDSTGTALIVGAGPRLGAAIARRLAADGFSVALVSHSEASVADVGETLRGEGISASWAVADVADPDGLRAAIDGLAEAATDGIDVAVHNVSVAPEGGGLDRTAGQLLADLAIGAASLLTITRAVAPTMIAHGRGTILATGSAAADWPAPGAPSLGVQKAALRALVQGLAGEFAPQGVHVATVTVNGGLGAPGFEPDRIAEVYAALVTETAGPREAWRTVVPYGG